MAVSVDLTCKLLMRSILNHRLSIEGDKPTVMHITHTKELIMKATDLMETQTTMEKGGIFVIPDAADLQIKCETGALWVTLDGDLHDYILNPNERFCVARHQRAVVYALSSSKMQTKSGVCKPSKVDFFGLRKP